MDESDRPVESDPDSGEAEGALGDVANVGEKTTEQTGTCPWGQQLQHRVHEHGEWEPWV